MHTESDYDGCAAYCYPEQGMADRCCDIYAHYARVADCADAMADAWEDTAGCAHADCLHGNILRYSKVIVHRYVGIAQDCANRIIDCAQRSTSVRI